MGWSWLSVWTVFFYFFIFHYPSFSFLYSLPRYRYYCAYLFIYLFIHSLSFFLLQIWFIQTKCTFTFPFSSYVCIVKISSCLIPDTWWSRKIDSLSLSPLCMRFFFHFDKLYYNSIDLCFCFSWISFSRSNGIEKKRPSIQ